MCSFLLSSKPNQLCCSVTKSCWLFQPHGPQHARLPCSTPSPEICLNSCPWSQWWHPTISSSVAPFSSSLPSFPASGSFPVSWLFTSETSASAPVLPVNMQGWLPFWLTGLISLLTKGLSKIFSSTTVQNINSSVLSLLYGPTLTSIHLYMTTGKTIALTIQTFGGKVLSPLFNMLSSFVTTSLSRNKCLIFMAEVTVHSNFGAQENKICYYFCIFPIYLPRSDETGCHDFGFQC